MSAPLPNLSTSHIPGAINIPLFTNEDRVIIGTLYKKQGKEPAMLKGMELASPRFADHIRKAQEISRDATHRLYTTIPCWCIAGGVVCAAPAWLGFLNGTALRFIRYKKGTKLFAPWC